MNLGVTATVFAIIAVAELPDKTMIATLIMGSRARPLLVWIGASAAFAVHVTIAVVAGRLLELLPHRVLELVVTILFAAGAAYLLFVPERAEEEVGEHEAAARKLGGGTGDRDEAGETGGASGADATRSNWKTVAGAFGIIFLGEFGDLTQLLTLNLVAKYHQAVSVFVGALAGLMATSALAAFGGRALLRVLPLEAIRRIGGIVLLGFALYNVYSLVK